MIFNVQDTILLYDLQDTNNYYLSHLSPPKPLCCNRLKYNSIMLLDSTSNIGQIEIAPFAFQKRRHVCAFTLGHYCKHYHGVICIHSTHSV